MNNNFNYAGGLTPQRNQFSSYFNPAPATNAATTNNLIWVQGIEGAKAWQLNPNSMVILLDSEAEGKMYIKVSDNIGMSSLRIFNYTEEIPTSANNNATINNDLDLSKYVTKDELTTLIKEILENEQSVSTVATTPTTANAATKPKVIIKQQ